VLSFKGATVDKYVLKYLLRRVIFVFILRLMIILGLIFIFIGWRIWKKEQITLIHSYHYTKVSENDRKPYTEKMGKACILMGIGIILTEIVNFATKTTYGWVIFVISFVWGMIIIIKAQKNITMGYFNFIDVKHIYL